MVQLFARTRTYLVGTREASLGKSKPKPENSGAEKKPHAGQFKPGQSGNPGGRPKGVAEVRDLAREHTPDVIRTLALLSKAADSDSARVAACKELLDRAWGKAPQEVKADVTYSSLTDEQLKAKLDAALAAAAGE